MKTLYRPVQNGRGQGTRTSRPLLRTLRVATFATAAVASIFCAPMAARSDDYISPDLIKVSTPTYKPWSGDFDPPLGTYTYTVSWEGIPAATATVKIDEDGVNYQVSANAETYSGIDLFYKLRYTMDGVLAGEDLAPITSSTSHRENSRVKTLDIKFAPSGEISAVREQVGKEGSKAEVKFVSNNPTLDPIGAAFLARSLQWERGASKTFDVFNGKSRYLVTLTAQDRTQIEYRGVMRDVWVITPRVKNLTTTEPVQKLRNAKVYVTTDSAREILKIESSVFIGSVYTELDAFEPKIDPNSPMRMAQLRRHSNSHAARE